MPVTMKDVRAFLDSEEVDYDSAKKLGPAALPFLQELAEGGNLALATKAVYLASLIKGTAARAIVERQSGKIFYALIDDEDPGIRKVAMNSAAHFTAQKALKKLSKLASSDKESFIRELATRQVARMKK
jgi:hypothetical protein